MEEAENIDQQYIFYPLNFYLVKNSEEHEAERISEGYIDREKNHVLTKMHVFNGMVSVYRLTYYIFQIPEEWEQFLKDFVTIL